MSLTLAVITKDGGERLRRLLDWVSRRNYFDEIRLFIDSTSTLPLPTEIDNDLRILIEPITMRNLDAGFAYAHSEQVIKTDWCLHLGDDELMGRWFDQDIKRLMQAPYDVYSFSRYNISAWTGQDGGYRELTPIPLDRYPAALEHIITKPWYPDRCQRLFRPGYLVNHGKVHEGPVCVGRLAMARPHVFHFDFVDQSLKERQDKWKKYLKQGVVKESRARGLADDYYKRWCLPEEFEHETEICKEPL